MFGTNCNFNPNSSLEKSDEDSRFGWRGITGPASRRGRDTLLLVFVASYLITVISVSQVLVGMDLASESKMSSEGGEGRPGEDDDLKETVKNEWKPSLIF